MLTIFQIILVFTAFCVINLGVNVVWKVVEGKLIIKNQENLMDAIYSKCVRMIARAISDFRPKRQAVEKEAEDEV